MAEGFGEPRKTKSTRIKKHTFRYKSTDGFVNIVRIEAASREEAVKEFDRFVRDLEFCLRVAGGLG